jgi:hypothetical protein
LAYVANILPSITSALAMGFLMLLARSYLLALSFFGKPGSAVTGGRYRLFHDHGHDRPTGFDGSSFRGEPGRKEELIRWRT